MWPHRTPNHRRDSLSVQDFYPNNCLVLNASRYQSFQAGEKLNFDSFSRVWLHENAAHWILLKILLLLCRSSAICKLPTLSRRAKGTLVNSIDKASIPAEMYWSCLSVGISRAITGLSVVALVPMRLSWLTSQKRTAVLIKREVQLWVSWCFRNTSYHIRINE